MKLTIFLIGIITAAEIGNNIDIANKIDIDYEMELSGFEPMMLLSRRLPQVMMNNTGHGLREKVYEMQHLYRKYKVKGLNAAETSSLLSIRKLMQLKTLVTALLGDSSVNFDRFCFYGCYCLPDAAVHDASPGSGKPVDEIDNACKELKMCYQCANRDSKADGGNECEQSSAYSVIQLRTHGEITDYQCTNTVDTCRWRICQCDRAFAHKIKLKHLAWEQHNHAIEGDFDRAYCEIDVPNPGSPKQCCGDYTSPYSTQQRQTINTNYEQCCNNNAINSYGNLC